jgi:hypothetical protein
LKASGNIGNLRQPTVIGFYWVLIAIQSNMLASWNTVKLTHGDRLFFGILLAIITHVESIIEI